jgi:hypothetical protein
LRASAALRPSTLPASDGERHTDIVSRLASARGQLLRWLRLVGRPPERAPSLDFRNAASAGAGATRVSFARVRSGGWCSRKVWACVGQCAARDETGTFSGGRGYDCIYAPVPPLCLERTIARTQLCMRYDSSGWSCSGRCCSCGSVGHRRTLLTT